MVIYTDGHVKWERWQNIQWPKTCPKGVAANGTSCVAAP